MAERPIFAPTSSGSRLVDEIPVQFTWHPGMAPSQKKKNVAELHSSAARKGISPLLEVSSKSELAIGQRLSAFHMPIRVSGEMTTVECAYQGSKIFEGGGPYHDLYFKDSRSAKRDERLRNSGKLIGFSLDGDEFPLSPPTAFYDWLYVNALYPHRDWLQRIRVFFGFTDIEFNPEKSLNCQARSCALFFALEGRGLVDDAMESFGLFTEVSYQSSLG